MPEDLTPPYVETAPTLQPVEGCTKPPAAPKPITREPRSGRGAFMGRAPASTDSTLCTLIPRLARRR